MTDKILINTTSTETWVAVIEQDKLNALYVEKSQSPSLVGNIYKGKVVRVVSGMDAAFVDIGLPRSGFLKRNDLLLNVETKTIHQLLHTGDELIVQVIKDAMGEKGVRLTTKFTHSFTTPVNAKSPCLIYAETSLPLRILRDCPELHNKEIIVNSNELYQRIININADKCYDMQLYNDKVPLFACFQIQTEIDSVLSREVQLKSGGNLVIDELEAMTVIDVNSGAFVGYRDNRATFLKINLDAAQEIGRQIRLRNLSGIIIIDFINMPSKRDITQVVSILKLALSLDKTPFEISKASPFGLVVMTRKRLQPSLKMQLRQGNVKID